MNAHRKILIVLGLLSIAIISIGIICLGYHLAGGAGATLATIVVVWWLGNSIACALEDNE